MLSSIGNSIVSHSSSIRDIGNISGISNIGSISNIRSISSISDVSDVSGISDITGVSTISDISNITDIEVSAVLVTLMVETIYATQASVHFIYVTIETDDLRDTSDIGGRHSYISN